MMRVISSPSSSTTGFATLIFAMRTASFFRNSGLRPLGVRLEGAAPIASRAGEAKPCRRHGTEDRRSMEFCFETHDAGGVKLHVASVGEPAAPLVVCLHGFPEYWAAWAGVMRELAGDFRLVAPDQRGF